MNAAMLVTAGDDVDVAARSCARALPPAPPVADDLCSSIEQVDVAGAQAVTRRLARVRLSGVVRLAAESHGGRLTDEAGGADLRRPLASAA